MIQCRCLSRHINIITIILITYNKLQITQCHPREQTLKHYSKTSRIGRPQKNGLKLKNVITNSNAYMPSVRLLKIMKLMEVIRHSGISYFKLHWHWKSNHHLKLKRFNMNGYEVCFLVLKRKKEIQKTHLIWLMEKFVNLSQ